MRICVTSYTDGGAGDRTLFRTLSGGESLFVLADGSEEAFASRYQPVIDLVKNTTAESLSMTTGHSQERLERADTTVREALARHFVSSTDFGHAQYSATYLAILLSGSELFARWIGSHQARLFRGGECVKATATHAMVLPGDAHIALALKSLSTVPHDALEQSDMDGPWELRPGDTLVIADYQLFLLDESNTIARLVSTAETDARSLVAWAESVQHQFARAAIVVHFG